MNQPGLKSYRLDVEEIEKLLQSQYGNSIQPVNYAKLRELKIQQARSAAFTASLHTEKAGSDTLVLENIDQQKLN